MNDPPPDVPGERILRERRMMLGVALVFVTCSAELGLGATLGYIVAGALIGPSGARL